MEKVTIRPWATVYRMPKAVTGKRKQPATIGGDVCLGPYVGAEGVARLDEVIDELAVEGSSGRRIVTDGSLVAPEDMFRRDRPAKSGQRTRPPRSAPMGGLVLGLDGWFEGDTMGGVVRVSGFQMW